MTAKQLLFRSQAREKFLKRGNRPRRCRARHAGSAIEVRAD
jgi:hypothetical protein